MTLDEKTDQITNQLLALLVQSEASLACDIHASKTMAEDDLSEPGLWGVSQPVSTGGSSSHDEPTSPRKKPPLPVPNLVIGVPVDSTPPLLSPPSPYRSPPFTVPDSSPPGSPPRHLQSTVDRINAGEKSPFKDTKKLSAASPPSSRPSTSDSMYSLMESIKITTAQCMVPSERESVDTIVTQAWEAASRVGFKPLPTTSMECPEGVLNLFANIRAMSPEEEHCQAAYVRLVYQLALETIKGLCPQKREAPVWTGNCTVRSLIVPAHFSNTTVSLETVQKKVYAALMRGQLPNQLPSVKFLHKMRRLGGREVDFVDQILIRELRGEEPGWVDYSHDEVAVKERTADALLESLVEETVGILQGISERRRVRELNRQAARTPA